MQKRFQKERERARKTDREKRHRHVCVLKVIYLERKNFDPIIYINAYLVTYQVTNPARFKFLIFHAQYQYSLLNNVNQNK